MKRWSALTYGCESWTLNKRDEERIRAFEMLGLRGILCVSWTAKRTNQCVMENAGVSRRLLKAIKKRKLTYFGHIMRKLDIIMGTLTGKRMNSITAWTGLTLDSILHNFISPYKMVARKTNSNKFKETKQYKHK